MSIRPIDQPTVEAAIAELVGLAINRTHRAVDMEMFDFGPQTERVGRRGQAVKIGTFGLHIQAPWRIIRDDRLVVGYHDVWDPPDGVAPDDWDPDESHSSRRDELVARWLTDPEGPTRVVAADFRPIGDLQLTFDDRSILEIVVDSTGGGREHWRLLRRDTDDHVVVNSKGAELAF